MSRFSKEMIVLYVTWFGLLLSLSLENASILSRIKEGYLMWVGFSSHIPRHARYSIGTRIENKFLDLLELSYTTYFTQKENKLNKIYECVFLLDTVKYLLSVTWEGKFISDKQFEIISIKLKEIGKMFGGWEKSLELSAIKNRSR